jgi:hypothetical protein
MSVAKTTASACVFNEFRFSVGHPQRHHAENFLHFVEAGMVTVADSCVEHGGRRCAGNRRGKLRGELLQVGSAHAKDQPRFGAELANAQRDGAAECISDLRSSLAQSAGEEEDRIQAAHFRENGNGIGAGARGIEEGAPCLA